MNWTLIEAMILNALAWVVIVAGAFALLNMVGA